jgi:hypothetical protein
MQRLDWAQDTVGQNLSHEAVITWFRGLNLVWMKVCVLCTLHVYKNITLCVPICTSLEVAHNKGLNFLMCN